MYQPKPGEWRTTPVPNYWEQAYFSRGSLYRVIKEFIDADSDMHKVGEIWSFRGAMFSRYDDLYVLYVWTEANDERLIPLLGAKDKQHDVVQSPLAYFAKINE